MKILILFAIITLVIFLILVALKQDITISIVVSVLCGTIISYFVNNMELTYTPENKDTKDADKNNTNTVKSSSSSSTSSKASDYSSIQSLLN